MIEIVGLGPGDPKLLTEQAKTAMKNAPRLLLRTERHPTVEWLKQEQIGYESFDALYESSPDFAALYTRIAESVIEKAQEQSLVYAVPGHPLIGEESVKRLLQKAKEQGIETRIIRSASFLEPMMEAVGASMSEGLQVWDAYSIDRYHLDSRLPQIIYQLDSSDIASNLKLRLMEFYSDEHQVAVVRSAGDEQRQSIEWIPLFELDRQAHDPLTSLYVPPMSSDRAPGIYGLVEVVAALREPETGCPWDVQQTHETLKKYLIEETYETLEAIDSGDPDKLCEELGDLFLQVLMHSQIAHEEGLYDIEEVSRRETDKLVRRHPHVFAGLDVSGADEVLKNWDKIKAAEKGENSRHSSILEGVPKAMPALMRAMEVSKRVARAGFEWQNVDGVFEKLEEETRELHEAVQSGDKEHIQSELGDLLFTIVNIARHTKIDPEEALRQMVLRFIDRFLLMEDEAHRIDRDLHSLSPDEWEDLWQRAKARLHGSDH